MQALPSLPALCELDLDCALSGSRIPLILLKKVQGCAALRCLRLGTVDMNTLCEVCEDPTCGVSSSPHLLALSLSCSSLLPCLALLDLPCVRVPWPARRLWRSTPSVRT